MSAHEKYSYTGENFKAATPSGLAAAIGRSSEDVIIHKSKGRGSAIAILDNATAGEQTDMDTYMVTDNGLTKDA